MKKFLLATAVTVATVFLAADAKAAGNNNFPTLSTTQKVDLAAGIEVYSEKCEKASANILTVYMLLLLENDVSERAVSKATKKVYGFHKVLGSNKFCSELSPIIEKMDDNVTSALAN